MLSSEDGVKVESNWVSLPTLNDFPGCVFSKRKCTEHGERKFREFRVLKSGTEGK